MNKQIAQKKEEKYKQLRTFIVNVAFRKKESQWILVRISP